MRSDRLKQVMQQIDSNFDERNAGFNRFSKFVVEAGQRGVVQVTKLDNGQFEVAPATGAGAAAPAGAAASGRPARDSGEAPREENGRRGRGRRGRGRDRGAGRERGEDRAPREPGREAAPARQARASDGTLSLARAFQLMTQALSELRAPVPHDALRLRMVAMHGREDPLLDAARFSRLLRQANDAEVADVRKVGDDEYEISPHRTGLMPAPGSAAVPATATPSPAPEEAQAGVESAAEAGSRENGQRLGLRFRRGSRAPMRTGEIPLIGVVDIETPAAEPAGVAVAEPPDEEAVETAPAPKKRTRARAPRKKAAAAPAAGVEEGGDAAAAAPAPKRTRSRPRAKKKAE
jgi:hypothetical protein